MKRGLPLSILWVTFLITASNFFLRNESIASAAKSLSIWGIIVSAFVLGLGAVNFLQVQAKNISAGKELVLSAAAIISFFVMAVAGIASNQQGATYQYLFQNMIRPLGDTMYSLLGFYIASAAYRAFRVRNAETVVLLLAAAAMLMGNTPLLGLISKSIPNFSSWVLAVPTMASRRAITVCAAIGALSSAVRALLGMDPRVTG